HRDVFPQPERVVLVDPRVVARLRAVLAQSAEAGARVLIERPALGTMVAGSLRAIERCLALAPVEAHQVSARARPPQHPVLVDVAAADAIGRRGHVIDLRELRLRIEAQETRRATEYADRVPDRAIHRAWHDSVRARAGNDALVL